MAAFFACGAAAQKTRQLETLQSLVTKHIQDPALCNIASGDEDFRITSTERGISRWEHEHLVAALDILNTYQSSRRQRSATRMMGHNFISRTKHYTHDPRTRLTELLKRWLRAHASSSELNEEEVRSICGLCRDILNHPAIFPARNPRSFLQTVAEVYDHLQCQLRQVLEKDRTCAELATKALCLSKNFLSDAIAYLLLAPTDLKQTDSLPSVEVVALWQSLPEEGHPLPGRADASQQKQMRDAWLTRCGRLIALIISTPQCVRLFGSAGAEDEAVAAATAILLQDVDESGTAHRSPRGTELPSAHEVLSHMRMKIEEEFEKGKYKQSGLAGAFRQPSRYGARRHYLNAIDAVFDLIFLFGDVLTKFHRLSDGLGDYGMIRAAPWLHPFLEALTDKVQRLKTNLEQLNQAADETYVLSRAKGVAVPKPAPTSRMCARAHASIERAVTGRGSHAQLLLQTLEELRGRSSPERLPQVMEGLGDACLQLQHVLASPEFRACVGDSFPELPTLGNIGASNSNSNGLQLCDVSDDPVDDCASTVSISTMHSSSTLATDATFASGATSDSSNMSWQPSRLRLTPVDRSRSPAPNRTSTPRSDRSSSKRTSSAPASQRVNVLATQTSVRRTLSTTRALSPARCCRESNSNPRAAQTTFGRMSSAVRALSPASSRRESNSLTDGAHATYQQEQQGATFSLHRGFISKGADLLQAEMTVEEAKLMAVTLHGCQGFCFDGLDDGQPTLIFFKRKWDINVGGNWSSYRLERKNDNRVEVNRLSESLGGGSWKRHDRRALELSRGILHIFDKGSISKVKVSVDVSSQVDECVLLSGGVLAITLRKLPNGAGEEDGVIQHKHYLFEFSSTRVATKFHEQINQLIEDGY